jgi:hypothetical protein
VELASPPQSRPHASSSAPGIGSPAENLALSLASCHVLENNLAATLHGYKPAASQRRSRIRQVVSDRSRLHISSSAMQRAKDLACSSYRRGMIDTLLTRKSISPGTIGPFYLGESNRPASSRGEAVKSTLQQICPPVVWTGLRSI